MSSDAELLLSLRRMPKELLPVAPLVESLDERDPTVDDRLRVKEESLMAHEPGSGACSNRDLVCTSSRHKAGSGGGSVCMKRDLGADQFAADHQKCTNKPQTMTTENSTSRSWHLNPKSADSNRAIRVPLKRPSRPLVARQPLRCPAHDGVFCSQR